MGKEERFSKGKTLQVFYHKGKVKGQFRLERKKMGRQFKRGSPASSFHNVKHFKKSSQKKENSHKNPKKTKKIRKAASQKSSFPSVPKKKKIKKEENKGAFTSKGKKSSFVSPTRKRGTRSFQKGLNSPKSNQSQSSDEQDEIKNKFKRTQSQVSESIDWAKQSKRWIKGSEKQSKRTSEGVKKKRRFGGKKEMPKQEPSLFKNPHLNVSGKEGIKAGIKHALKAAINVFTPKGWATLVGGGIVGFIGLGLVLVLSVGFLFGMAHQSSQEAQDKQEDISSDLAGRASQFYAAAKKKNPNVTINGIAAVLGNFEIESNLNPKRAEGDYLPPPIGAINEKDPAWDNPKWLALGGPDIYDGGFSNILHRGLGYGQWTDTADGGNRHTLLLEYAKSQKKKWYDLSLQVDFMIEGDSPRSQAIFKTITESKGMTNGLTKQFLEEWEGNPGDKLSERQKAASKWATYLKDQGQGTGKPSATPPPEYKDKIKFPLPSDQCTNGGYPGNAYAWGNCTWYVYNRFYQLGKTIDPYLGDGGSWGANAAAKGYKTSSTPHAGDAVSFAPGAQGSSPIYGHVAFVEFVNPDGSFLVSEMNVVGLDVIDYRVIPNSSGCTFITF